MSQNAAHEPARRASSAVAGADGGSLVGWHRPASARRPCRAQRQHDGVTPLFSSPAVAWQLLRRQRAPDGIGTRERPCSVHEARSAVASTSQMTHDTGWSAGAMPRLTFASS